MTLVPIKIAILEAGSILMARIGDHEKNRKCLFSCDINRNWRLEKGIH